MLTDLKGAAMLIAAQPATTRRMAAAGEVPGTRVGGQWRFWKPALLTRVAGADAAAHALGDYHPSDDPGVVDIHELADLLGLSEGRLSLLLRQGDVPATKVGRQWRAYWPAIRDRIAAGQSLGEHTEPEEEVNT